LVILIQRKKTFTKYLLGTAILLLLANVTIDFIKKPKRNDKNSARELTTGQIDSVFLDVLDQYGIEQEWISTKKIKIPNEDSISKQYTVKLPIDLSIPLIIKNVNKIIENDITGFVSEEKKIFGATEIRIYTNELLKLKATLIPDSGTVRNRNDLTFIISDAYDLNQSGFNAFLSIPYTLTAAMVPGENTVAKADSLKKYSKEYLVLINNDMNDTKFRLEKGDQKELLKNSVNNIISNFRNARLFTIDDQSKLFNSTIYNFIRDEFKKRRIKLIRLSEFLTLNADEDAELISKFRFYCVDKTGSRQKIFYLTFEDFQKINNELEKFRRKGNNILALSSTNFVIKEIQTSKEK
jgi:hypothetical protein